MRLNIFHRAKNFTVCTFLFKAEIYREFTENVERMKKRRNLRISALILAGTIFVGGLVYTGKRLSDKQDIKIATSMAIKDAEDELTTLLMLKRGGSVTFLSENGARSMFDSLSTSDYAKISIDNLGQIYSYKLILGDTEFEEFIKSIRYLENNEERCYTSFRQFLNINGFSSEEEFVNKAEAILLKQYGNELNKSKGGI